MIKILLPTIEDGLLSDSLNMCKEHLFKFKQFSISHAKSSMKVGTDAVLLGSWVDISKTETILDIGTGCGIIALMLAQRSQAKIDAIDIDEDSIEEATLNFRQSPWPDRLHAHHTSLQTYQEISATKYDLIVSNPPYFQNSMLPTKEGHKLAKHCITLNYDELIRLSTKLLRPNGRLAIILPNQEADNCSKIARSYGHYLQDQLYVQTTSASPVVRCILVFNLFDIINISKSNLTIRNDNGTYTDEYMELTKAFHPFFRD